MKKNRSLAFLAQSMLAAFLMIPSALADVGGHLMVEASGIKTGSEQLDVRFTGNGEVRISWDEQSMRNAILQVSTNCVDWTEVANASSPFFTPLNNEVSTYYRVVYVLSGGTTDPPAVDVPPVDFGRVGMLGATQDSGVIARGVFGVDDSPGPDLLWEDGDGDELVDEEELTALGAGHDTLKAIINNLRGVDGESVPVPIEWLEEILDRLSLAQGHGGSGPGIGMIVSVNPAFGADTFRDRLEAKAGLHDSVHCIVGGTMCSARSSNDPVFFSHHANVDKVVEGQTQDLLIAVVDFPDDLSGSVSSMLHDSSMAVIRKIGGTFHDDTCNGVDDDCDGAVEDGYPVLIHGIAAADSPIEGFWVSPSISVDALASEVSAVSLHNNGAFLPWHREYITFPDDLGPPGGSLQESRDPVPVLITEIWTDGSGTRLDSDLDWLVDHLWQDDESNPDEPARLVMLGTGPISLGSLGPNGQAGMDVGPVGAQAQPLGLVMRDGSGNAIGRQGEVYFLQRENNDGNLSRRLHDTAMAVIRKINAAPPNGGGGGGGRVVVRAVSLQVNSEDGSDPVLGGVIYRDRGKSSPKIAEQALSGDEGPGDDIGLVLIDPLDKSSPKIAHAMFKAGESLAQENLVIFLDDEAADGDHSLAVAVTGPVQKVLSALGIGSEHWPEPALQGEEVGPIFLVIEEEETNLTLDFSWDFPQDYDAMRNRLEHGPGLSDGDHLVITGTLVDGVWTNGSASTIGNGIIIRPEMVERTGVDGDPPTGSLEWLDAFLKDIFASSFAGQAGGEITGVIAPQGDVGLGGPIGLAGNDPLFQMIMIRPEMVARAVRGGITRIDHRGRSGTGSSH